MKWVWTVSWRGRKTDPTHQRQSNQKLPDHPIYPTPTRRCTHVGVFVRRMEMKHKITFRKMSRCATTDLVLKLVKSEIWWLSSLSCSLVQCRRCDPAVAPPLVLAGCRTEWDEIGCWLKAEVGQVVNLSCSEVFQHFSSNQGEAVSMTTEANFLFMMDSLLPPLIICVMFEALIQADKAWTWIIHVCLLFLVSLFVCFYLHKYPKTCGSYFKRR